MQRQCLGMGVHVGCDEHAARVCMSQSSCRYNRGRGHHQAMLSHSRARSGSAQFTVYMHASARMCQGRICMRNSMLACACLTTYSRRGRPSSETRSAKCSGRRSFFSGVHLAQQALHGLAAPPRLLAAALAAVARRRRLRAARLPQQAALHPPRPVRRIFRIEAVGWQPVCWRAPLLLHMLAGHPVAVRHGCMRQPERLPAFTGNMSVNSELRCVALKGLSHIKITQSWTYDSFQHRAPGLDVAGSALLLCAMCTMPAS